MFFFHESPVLVAPFWFFLCWPGFFVVPQRKNLTCACQLISLGPELLRDIQILSYVLALWSLEGWRKHTAHVGAHTNQLTTLPCWWSTYDAASSRRKQFLEAGIRHHPFDLIKACCSFISQVYLRFTPWNWCIAHMLLDISECCINGFTKWTRLTSQ